MLKGIKRGVLRSLERSGFARLVEDSRWRRNRLLILCYHGISLEDEHLCNHRTFIPPADLEHRLATLREHGCALLPFQEALDRLYESDLPPRSVTLTFDDGGYDFQAAAWPILKKCRAPATVYLSTYYCDDNRPVFDGAAEYLLWKGRGQVLDGSAAGLKRELDLRGEDAPGRVWREVLARAKHERLDAGGKDALLAGLARVVGVDYAAFVRQRMFCLLAPEEVRALASDGVDFQLHTHRHRTPLDRETFAREVRENRDRIRALTGRDPVHFCYPSGVHRPEFLGWLRQEGVRSATTCEPGLAKRSSNPLLLPRVVDHGNLGPVEFTAWLAGTACFLPRRASAGGRR